MPVEYEKCADRGLDVDAKQRRGENLSARKIVKTYPRSGFTLFSISKSFIKSVPILPKPVGVVKRNS